MPTEKKVIAKLTVKTSMNSLTLLIFAHASGLVTYHLMSEISMSNRSLDELNITKALPCVHFDYVNTKNLVNAIVTAIESSKTVHITARNEYEDK